MKIKAELKEIIIYCEKLKRKVMIDASKCFWFGSSYGCELCGGHRRVEVEVSCKCGKNHKIVVYEC